MDISKEIGAAILSSSGKNFFAAFEQYFNSSEQIIPQKLKNILSLLSLDNALTLRKLNDDVVRESTNIMRKLTIHMISSDAQLEDYLGIFTKCPREFEFLPGEIILLKIMAKLVRHLTRVNDGDEAILSSSGKNFFAAFEQYFNSSEQIIPQKLKNILSLLNLDNAVTLGKLNKDLFEDLNRFMSHTFKVQMIPSDAKLEDYLGVFTTCQFEFEFLPGETILLKIMTKLARRVTKMNDFGLDVIREISSENTDDDGDDNILDETNENLNETDNEVLHEIDSDE